MPTKTPAAISATLTIVSLILLAILFVLLEMVALNGASKRQGIMAMALSLGALAARATTLLITRVACNSILAVVVTVLAATTIGGVIASLSRSIAIPGQGYANLLFGSAKGKSIHTAA